MHTPAVSAQTCKSRRFVACLIEFMSSDPLKSLNPLAPASLATSPVLHDVLVFDWTKQTFAADLIFVLPVALCLAIGLGAGHPGAGLITAGGATTIGFGAKQQIEGSRLLPMILASIGIAFSVFVGMIAGHENTILVPLAALWGFGYGMLTQREAGYGWVGQQCVVTLLVASAFPFSARAALVRASLLLAGGAIQVVWSSIAQRMWGQLRKDLTELRHHIRAEQEALRTMMADVAGHVRQGQFRYSVFPYALRLMVTLGISTEIYRRLHFSSGYWIPMTALLVLKPGIADTASRAIARTVGTIAGAWLISVLVSHLAPSTLWLAIFTVVFSWLSYATMNINYALFALCITAQIVFLLSLDAIPGKDIAIRRAVCTAIGGALALSVRLMVLYRRRAVKLAA
jgi:hypothetical protein